MMMMMMMMTITMTVLLTNLYEPNKYLYHVGHKDSLSVCSSGRKKDGLNQYRKLSARQIQCIHCKLVKYQLEKLYDSLGIENKT